jgi:hypothetical protein
MSSNTSHRIVNIWTLVDLAESKSETGTRIGIEKALQIIKPTRRECEIIARQNTTVTTRIQEAIENTTFGKNPSLTTNLFHPISGKKVCIDIGSDDGFLYFLRWVVSQGRDVCLQLVSDPNSMMPIEGNWTLFEKTDYQSKEEQSENWTIKQDENYLCPLDNYWRVNYIDPDSEYTIETYIEYPLDGFVCRSPKWYDQQLAEESIRVLSTEKSATTYYATNNY